MIQTITVTMTGLTHNGRLRTSNDDTIAMADWIRNAPMLRPESVTREADPAVVCLVADGLGGHRSGAKASGLAARALAERASDLCTVVGLEQRLRELNTALSRWMEERPEDAGMGTTVAGIVIHNDGVLSFNVGDSRVYRRCDGYLRQISTDDRPSLQQAGEPDSGSSIVTQALGGSIEGGGIAPHVAAEPVRDGAFYLLCTDGLTDVLDLDTIESRIADDDSASIVGLFDLAMSVGAPDNLSIVITRISSECRS